MATIKIGTFNVENLFLRYRRLSEIEPEEFDLHGNIGMLRMSIDDYGPVGEAARELTARVIAANDPDLLAVQEVENMEALKLFNEGYLAARYPFSVTIDGNDPRQIDVGLYSKLDIVGIRTDQFDPPGSDRYSRTFSRDCLQVDVATGEGKTLTLLVNHFKSQLGDVSASTEKRRRQARRVAQILQARFGPDLDGDFAVCGDLNNGPQADELQPLLGLPGLVNVVERLPEEQRWTHYYAPVQRASQLDYVLLSPRLAQANPDANPWIERRGLGTDIAYYTGPRFTTLTGADGASDHCAVFISIAV